MLRLVRDDDAITTVSESSQPIRPRKLRAMRLQTEATEPTPHLELPPVRLRRRKAEIIEESSPATEPLPAPIEADATARISDAIVEEVRSTDESPTVTDAQPTEEESADGIVAAIETDADEADGDAQPIDTCVLESLLFSTHHPLTASRLAELMELPGPKPLRKAIATLNKSYEESGRSFRVEQVAGGYQLLTLPQYGEHLKRLHQKEVDTKLTKAALETLAIIAYKQPLLRVDIEAIRGVACGETIRTLMEKHLVRIAGRAEEPGRPILYGTTKRFLELFGLNSLKDLPGEPQEK